MMAKDLDKAVYSAKFLANFYFDLLFLLKRVWNIICLKKQVGQRDYQPGPRRI